MRLLKNILIQKSLLKKFWCRICKLQKMIDTMLRGDIEDIEIELGLRETRDTSGANMFGFGGDRIVRNTTPHIADEKIGRNDSCPCGSGKKYKKCCINN